MYVSGLGPTLRRHWRLAVAGGLATLGLCAAALIVIPPTYQAESSVLILPSTSAVGEGGNPYLALGGLQPTTDAVARAMADEQVVQGLRTAGAIGDYVVETDRTTGGPVLLVTVKGPRQAEALTTLQLVLKRIPTTLAQLQQQADVPSKSRLVAQVLAQDRVASPVLKTRIRGLAVAAAAGIAGTVGGIVLLDNLARIRRRKVLTRVPADEDEPPAPPAPLNGADRQPDPLPVDRFAPLDEETLRIRRPTDWLRPAEEEATRIRTRP